MRFDLTDITILLDRSVSMARRVTETIASVNAFIAEQRALTGAGHAQLTLVQFADVVREPDCTARPLEAVSGLNRLAGEGQIGYSPAGPSTALCDALGITIVAAGARLAAIPEAERPAGVVFVVVTDGEENSSREYTNADVQRMVVEQTETYRWAFVFLGAGIDAFSTAASTGITPQSGGVLNVGNQAGKLGAAVQCTSSNVAAYRQKIGAHGPQGPQGAEEQQKLSDDAKRLLQYSEDQISRSS